MVSNEFLMNMKSIPDASSQEYEAFWDNERHKAEYGLTVNGVFIPDWLYWHTQLWTIYDDIEDTLNHTIKRQSLKASFRDNEWIIAEGLQEAKDQRKGVMFFGSRRLGKSEFISSYIGQGATLFEGSENVVMGGNWGDIDVIMAKIVHGLNHIPNYFKFGRLSENLRKEIELGFKDKKGTRLSWSKIICRNHEEGLDTESPAGLTPSRFIMDEVGKSPFAKVFGAAKPSFTSKFGWRCVPILTGTSGDIKKGSDAQKFFENPESNNFIVRYLKDEGEKKVSVFINGLYRMEGKVETTLGAFVQNEKGILLPEDSELFTIPMSVKDDEKALAVIDAEREQASKSPDPSELLKATMYYPKNTKELFLSDDGNNFPAEAINEMIAYLQANPDLQGQTVRLYRDASTKVKISFNTDKRRINDYPLKPDADKDGAIIIYEIPEPNPPLYLYIAGADPYNQSNSKWSSSLGSVYIYKRMYDPINGTYQRRIVAEYTGRPETLKEWHENVEMLLEVYNAVCLPENEAATFIQYFDGKNKSHWLADGYSFLKEISPTTSIKGRIKGLPATVRVQAYYKELVFQYLTEELDLGFNDQGEPIKKLGLTRIPSIGLLKELAAFTTKGNYDRYVAFGHVLAHEVWADKIYPFVQSSRPDEEKKDYRNKPVTHSPFGLGTNNPFSKGNNPFGIKSLRKR